MRSITKLWIGVLILLVLSPLGLIIPAYFKAGPAWGEWGIDQIKEIVGYIPKGMERLANFWRAPVPDYGFKGWEGRGLWYSSFAYILSAIIGILAVVVIIYLVAKFLTEKDQTPPLRVGVAFIEQSLIKTLRFIKDAVFAEEYSRQFGFLQILSPRIKLMGLVIILLVIALLKHIYPILIFYILSIILAYLSKINLIYFIKRVWIFIPLFCLFIAIPALFNIFSPGEIIFWGITKQGLLGATLFILRVLTSVSFSVLLVLTTPHTSLLQAMRFLGISQVFVVTFMMCYRYIYIFIKVVEDTYLAIKCRLITNIKYRKAHKIIAWRIGTLWEKSRLMSEEVYLAMLSRGYSGEPK